jgi:2-polyprenyl-6-methoxyphenol hydroxylase-like FAD-dependent oxidoreductase
VTPPVAVVAGAGIAGLAAAHALDRLGFEVRLLERDHELRTEGAGLSLWPNATRALRELGLVEALEECAHAVPEGATLTPAGKTIGHAPLARITERFGPLLSVHRGEFLAALRERAKVPVELGAELSCAAGTLYLRGRRVEADLVLGADGIGSAVRELVAAGQAPRSAGQGAWRGIAQMPGLGLRRASETMGRGRRFGLVPLSGERVYWFAVLTGDGASAGLEDAFGGWHEPIAAVLDATPPSERSYLPLRDLAPLPRWHSGGAVLVGDAAHAMTPNLGQGAAQALVDVAVLCRELAQRPPAEAFLAYERARKARAEQIVRRSRAVGRVAQMANPLAVGLRNALVRRIPPALVARQMEGVLR